MSCHRTESCQSPVMVTENRFFLNGEPWVLAREADLPIHVERQADLPQVSAATLDCGKSQSCSDRPRRTMHSDSSPLPKSTLRHLDLESTGGRRHNWQGTPELESPEQLNPYHPNTVREPQNCVGTGSCKRLHLSHPHLCKKIVQKARRALSKLGRRPGSKIFRSPTTPLLPRQTAYDFTMPMQDAKTPEKRLSDVMLPELPAGGNAVHEMPTGSATAENVVAHEAFGKAVVRCEPRATHFAYYSDDVSPLSYFHGCSGSGSSISTWNEKPSQSSFSTRCTSITPDLMSPARRLSELEASVTTSSPFSCSTPANIASRPLPTVGETVLAKTGLISERAFDRTQLDTDISMSTTTTLWHMDPPEASFMGDWDVCSSPTSLMAPGGFSNRQAEDVRVYELDSGDYNTRKSTFLDAPCLDTQSEGFGMLGNCPKKASSSISSSAPDSTDCDTCQPSVPLCPCHGLPMRPDMHLSDLVAGARSCGVSSHLLVQDGLNTLGGRLESMLCLLLKLALERVDKLGPEIQVVLAPAFKPLPTFEAALKALQKLSTHETLPPIHELVSLVFVAFSVAILTVDERSLPYYNDMLYIDVASRTKAFSSPSDKHIFDTFLEVLWLPQVSGRFASFEQHQFCPFTIPKRQSILESSSSLLSTHLDLRTGMAARICQYYVDSIHHAAENEIASKSLPAYPMLEEDRPPLFAEFAMADLMQPHLELPISERLREVVLSTAQVIRNGHLSSFAEVDAHFRSGVLERQEHFGNLSNRTSGVFSAMCHNVATVFADRKVAWLIHNLQTCASRVVSQSWAEGIDTQETNVQTDHEYTGSNPGVLVTYSKTRNSSAGSRKNKSTKQTSPKSRSNNPTRVRETVRQKRVSQGPVPSKCSQCSQIFEGKCRRDHLRRHLKSVHGDQYLTCLLCGRRLKCRTDNFAKHLRAVHPDHVGPVKETGTYFRGSWQNRS